MLDTHAVEDLIMDRRYRACQLKSVDEMGWPYSKGVWNESQDSSSSWLVQRVINSVCVGFWESPSNVPDLDPDPDPFSPPV